MAILLHRFITINNLSRKQYSVVKTVHFFRSFCFCLVRNKNMDSKDDITTSIPMIDIGANLVDEMYQGMYNLSKKHEPDLQNVLKRAEKVGIKIIFITAGNIDESINAADLAKTHSTDELQLYSTVGVHPTRCSDFYTKSPSPEKHILALKGIISDNKDKVIALGEFGLDYERTQYCDIETQKKFFEMQLKELGPDCNLPLFLHCRGAAEDLAKILEENKNCYQKGGVVHSFDGTSEELHTFLKLGFYIGINGCSLKQEENCKVVQEIPLDRLMLETDAPWCGIRPSHFSSKFVKTKFEASKKIWSKDIMFKSRNEPQALLNVLEVVSGLKEIDIVELGNIVFNNTKKLFFPNCV